MIERNHSASRMTTIWMLVISSIAKRRPSRPSPLLPVAAVGHVVGAKVGRVVDDHPAKVEPLDGLKDRLMSRVKTADLQAELGIIRLAQRFLEIVA